jgi:hypothetical protein
MSLHRTIHAEERMATRAVSKEAYEVTMLFAKSTYRKNLEAEAYYFDKESLRDVKEFAPEVYARELKTLRNIEIVVLNDKVVTVIRKDKRSSKKHHSFRTRFKRDQK